MTRVPIISNLNIGAWEKELSAYQDNHLLLYIKFGFPLSIRYPKLLTNTKVVNHYSLQYRDAVIEYIAKEQS